MHSLSFKVFTDFNTTSRRCSSAGGGIGGNGFVAVPGRREVGRLRRIVACASERNGGGAGEKQSSGSGPIPTPSSLLSRSQTYALLKQQMEVAAKSEDYKEAARIRDSLKSFEAEEPILRLRRSIKEAIAEERFEDAARYRDELKEIAPHSLLKCSSDATTLGIRVQVRSVYIEGRSQPSKGQYFFAYRTRITNNSNRPRGLPLRPVGVGRARCSPTPHHGPPESSPSRRSLSPEVEVVWDGRGWCEHEWCGRGRELGKRRV